MKHFVGIALLFFLFVLPVGAQNSGGLTDIIPNDPSVLLGLNPDDILKRFGSPDAVFAVRGNEAWQDDVVFDYKTGCAFFLFMNNVWQIRIGDAYKAPVLGFTLGSSKERAVSVFGTPYRDENDICEWALPHEAWPVHLRAIVGENGAIRELYIYRADF